MEIIRIGAMEIRFLVDRHASADSLDMFELVVPPGASVPIPHYHESWEETVYGLEGVMTWIVNGVDHPIGPGQALLIPRGAVHQFVNRGEQMSKALNVLTPGVLGPEYFRELEALVAEGGPPDKARVSEIMLRYGLVPVPG